MKNINISTEYILIYFAKSIFSVFTNLIQKDTLCDINYIFEDQGINRRKTYILPFHKTLLEQDGIFDVKIRISFSDLYFGP